jgi:hypothetical protein
MNLYTNRATITETGSFDEAMGVIVKAFLVSPSFLSRAEISETADGQYFALNGYEVANRLSYMLWGTMPDDTLFAAAAANQLSTKEQIKAQAERMLADPKARALVAEFHADYTLMGPGGKWSEITRDTTKYPQFNESLVPVLSEETEAFFDYTTFDAGGSFQDLLTSTIGFVNNQTAPLYGLDASSYGGGLEGVDLGTTRPGVFTRVGFLTAHSLFDRTSPILRGAFLQKEIMCANVPLPDPDILANPPPLPTGADLITNRDRVQKQTEPAECSGCHHNLINPMGFPLESFSAVGSVQTTDNDQGVAVNTQATVPMGQNMVDVAGPEELMAAIAASADAQRCYAQKWAEFAYQRAPNANDNCIVNEMATKTAGGGYSIVSLVADLTQSDSFRLRAMEVAQ